MLIDDHMETQSVDKVLFCVTGTEVYINDMYADTIYLYADDKKCYDTYVLMAEVYVCNVLHVVAIFYSNPGTYISLSYQSSS